MSRLPFTEKQREWLLHIQSWQRSNLSMVNFCNERGLKLSSDELRSGGSKVVSQQQHIDRLMEELRPHLFKRFARKAEVNPKQPCIFDEIEEIITAPEARDDSPVKGHDRKRPKKR